MSRKTFERLIVDEISETGDWVSIAGALGANDISAFNASADQIWELIASVESSARLVFGAVHSDGFHKLTQEQVRKSVSEAISESNPSERVAHLMNVYIDDTES